MLKGGEPAFMGDTRGEDPNLLQKFLLVLTMPWSCQVNSPLSFRPPSTPVGSSFDHPKPPNGIAFLEHTHEFFPLTGSFNGSLLLSFLLSHHLPAPAQIGKPLC